MKRPEGIETPRGPAAASKPERTEAEIAAYLEAHPDFIQRHPALLRALVPPSVDRGRDVVDFQRYMVTRLQGDIVQSGAERTALIQTARANAHNQSRIHQGVLALIEAPGLGQLIEVLTGDLAVMLDVDVIAMLVEANGADIPRVASSGIRVVEPGAITARMGRRDVILQGGIAGDPEIFGPAAGLVKSEGLLKLSVSRHAPIGLLAFGSRDPEMFQKGQGTELIAFLGNVVERLIRQWLDLPA